MIVITMDVVTFIDSKVRQMRTIDRLYRQARESEAMWWGATMGAATLAGKLAEVRVKLDARSNAFDEALAHQITALCDRDAYRALAETLIIEIMDASKPRRLSSPSAHKERARLLEDTHQASWKRIVDKTSSDPNVLLTDRAKAISKKISRERVRGYFEAVAKTGPGGCCEGLN